MCYSSINIFIYDSQRKQSTRKEEAVHPDIFWVYRLFYFSGIGGVECGESTGRRKHNRSI